MRVAAEDRRVGRRSLAADYPVIAPFVQRAGSLAIWRWRRRDVGGVLGWVDDRLVGELDPLERLGQLWRERLLGELGQDDELNPPGVIPRPVLPDCNCIGRIPGT